MVKAVPRDRGGFSRGEGESGPPTPTPVPSRLITTCIDEREKKVALLFFLIFDLR